MKFRDYIHQLVLWVLLIVGAAAAVPHTWLYVTFLPLFGYNFADRQTPLIIVADWFFGFNFVGVWPALLLIAVCIIGLKRSQFVPVKAVETSSRSRRGCHSSIM
jgi:hypothetical protein